MKRLIVIILITSLLMISAGTIYILRLNNFENENIGILKGKVVLKTGSCGPSACGPEGCYETSCFERGVVRKISIRELRTEKDVNNLPYFNNNESDLIKSIESNEDGYFTINLPVGNYSIFAVENGTGGGWEQMFQLANITFNEYCDRIDHFGDSFVVCPIEIKKNQITEFNLTISYAAV